MKISERIRNLIVATAIGALLAALIGTISGCAVQAAYVAPTHTEDGRQIIYTPYITDISAMPNNNVEYRPYYRKFMQN